MPYSTPADIEAAIGAEAYLDLTDRSGDGTAEVSALVSTISDVDAEIDSYIARYTPLSEVPALVRRASIVLAIYEHRELHATDEERLRAERVRVWLRDISTGRAKLVLSSGQEEDTSGGNSLDGETIVESRESHFAYDERGWF